MRSLGDSGEILVVHLKKLFRRPRSASRLLFTLCPIPFFLLWLVASFTAETLQWFVAPWSSIWSYTLSARGTFPQGNLQHVTLDLSPKTGHQEERLHMFLFSSKHSVTNQDSLTDKHCLTSWVLLPLLSDSISFIIGLWGKHIVIALNGRSDSNCLYFQHLHAWVWHWVQKPCV